MKGGKGLVTDSLIFIIILNSRNLISNGGKYEKPMDSSFFISFEIT